MKNINGKKQVETTVPIYKLLMRDYINKSDFINLSLIVFEHAPNNQTMRVLEDTQGTTFVSLFSIARNCGFSNWSIKAFTDPIKNLDFKIYRQIPSGNFIVRTSDVARIVKKIITEPFTESNTQIDDVIINLPSKFLEWWENTANEKIELVVSNRQSLFNGNAEVTSDRNKAINQARDTPIFDKLCLGGKSDKILIELDLLAIQVNHLIAADLPHVIAVKTAINIRRKHAMIDDYAPIIEFIKRINPSINI